MRLIIFFLFLGLSLQAQLPTRLKLKQLEVSTDPAPSYSYMGGYGQVPVTDNDGNLVYPLPYTPGPIADLHQGVHIGVSNAWKNRGIIRDNLSDYHIAFQWPPNAGWTPTSGITQATLYRSTWNILYTGSTSQTNTNCPSTNYYKVKMSGSSVVPPVAGDPLMLIRGESHRGLVDTLRNVYDYSNGYRVISALVDSVLVTGELATRTKLWARTVALGNNPVADGISMIELSGARSEIVLPTYTSARNDAGAPTNFLSTNNTGVMRANPLTDILLNGSAILDFGSIPAGGMLESGDISLTGIVENKPIAISGGSTFTAGLILNAYATATGFYRIRIYNGTAAPIDPPNQFFYINQIKI